MRFEEFKRELEGLELIGKGWRSYVYRALWKGKPVAVKVAKDKSREQAIRKEGQILERLKGQEGFPNLVMKGVDFVAYEFVEGVPFEKLSLSMEKKLRIYAKVVELIEIMDRLGINKDELQRLDKNLIVGEGDRVVLIDFERGSLDNKKRHNLSQFLQLLVREGILDKDKAIELGRRYSAGDDKAYEETKAIIERAIREIA